MNRVFGMLASVALALAAVAPACAQDGVSDKSIVIGQSAAFTGPAAQLGIQMRSGAKLWIDQVNAQGGIHGRQIDLRTRDDKYESNLAAENTKKFINEDRVFALFAYVGTPTSQASLPIFTEARVPFIGAFTGAELLRTPFNRYVFNIRASYYDETEAIVEHLTRIGARKIAVFHQADSYGQAGLDGTTRALSKRSLKIHSLGTVERNTTNIAEAVKTIDASQPDAVVMISAYTATAEFVRQMKKSGSVASFYTVSFVGSKALADALGKEGHGVTISQVVPFPWSPLTPIVKEYLDLAKKSGNVEVNFSSLEGFIAAKVLTEGLRRAGRDLTRERFVAALENITNLDLGGFGVSFSASNHNASRFVDLAMVGREGRFVR
ncbi:MAG: ABC transporter substrate-binding protein [Thermoanaerobaculia bacterium]